jgi:hypothetical protein
MTEPGTRESRDRELAVRAKVIYVMGAGRSGSTILGLTLGNSEGVFYAGELDAWLPRSGMPQLDDPERERFWAGVREQVSGAEDLFGQVTLRAIERSKSIFRVNLWRQRRRLREPYRRVARQLYEAVCAAAGTDVVVDTSHYPLRARELQAIDGIDLHIVYLMRDPQSVVASFDRRDVAQYSKTPLTTNIYLWLTNLLAVSVFLRQPRERRLFVRYEDFIADPAGAVREITAMAGVHAPTPDFTALRTGLAFQGNRVIRSAEVALEGTVSRPASPSLMTTILQLPWAAVLGRLQPTISRPATPRRLHAVPD